MKPKDIDSSRTLAKNMVCERCKSQIHMQLSVAKVGELEWLNKYRVLCKCDAVEVGLGPDDFMDPYTFATQVSFEHRPKHWPPLVSSDEGLNFSDHDGLSGV